MENKQEEKNPKLPKEEQNVIPDQESSDALSPDQMGKIAGGKLPDYECFGGGTLNGHKYWEALGKIPGRQQDTIFDVGEVEEINKHEYRVTEINDPNVIDYGSLSAAKSGVRRAYDRYTRGK